MIGAFQLGVVAAALDTVVAGSVADPPWSSVFLLAHLNSSVGTLYPGDLVDSSSYHRTIGIGNVAGTASGKFGNGVSFSYYNGPALYCANGSGSDIGTGDFTIEWWIKSTYVPPLTSNRPPHIFSPLSGYSSTSLRIWMSRGDSFDGPAGSISLALPNGGGIIVTTGVSVSDGQFHHIAISRVSGVSRIFMDGVLKQAASDSNNYTQWATSGFYVVAGDGLSGSSTNTGTSTFYSATVDEIRMCKYGLYTATFSPPTAPFPDA